MTDAHMMDKPDKAAGVVQAQDAGASAASPENSKPDTLAALPASPAKGSAPADYWISTGKELARFYAYRMDRNYKAIDRFASCRTGQDLIAATSALTSATLHDYAEEFDRLFARRPGRMP